MPENQETATGAEQRDVDTRRVLVVAVVILAGLFLSVLAVGELLSVWKVPAGTGPNRPLDFPVARPALDSAPQDDRRAYMAEKERQLHLHEWRDRKAGIARIPIETAMEILAGRGGRP